MLLVTIASPTANLRLSSLCSLSDSFSRDSGLLIFINKNDTVLENKRGDSELGPLPGSSPQRAAPPAHSCSDGSLRRILSSSIMMPCDDTPEQLAAARNIVDNAVGEFVVESAEAVDNRTHHRIGFRPAAFSRPGPSPRLGMRWRMISCSFEISCVGDQ